MTKFNFKLESLRALREQSEQQAKEELARELARKAERQAELDAAEGRLAAARTAGQLAEGSTVSAHELVSTQAFLERRERERHAAQAGVSAQEAEVGASRERLQTAARDRTVLERLKQRRAEEHRREAARAEEKALDEIAITSHRRAAEDTAA